MMKKGLYHTEGLGDIISNMNKWIKVVIKENVGLRHSHEQFQLFVCNLQKQIKGKEEEIEVLKKELIGQTKINDVLLHHQEFIEETLREVSIENMILHQQLNEMKEENGIKNEIEGMKEWLSTRWKMIESKLNEQQNEKEMIENEMKKEMKEKEAHEFALMGLLKESKEKEEITKKDFEQMKGGFNCILNWKRERGLLLMRRLMIVDRVYVKENDGSRFFNVTVWPMNSCVILNIIKSSLVENKKEYIVLIQKENEICINKFEQISALTDFTVCAAPSHGNYRIVILENLTEYFTIHIKA